jgi:hypothetical protein
VKLLIVALLVIVPAALVGVWAGRHLSQGLRHDPSVESNARLTGYAAVVLLIPLAYSLANLARDLEPCKVSG